MIEVTLNHAMGPVSVVIGQGCWQRLAKGSGEKSQLRNFYLSDETVWSLYGKQVARFANVQEELAPVYLLEPGESSKTLATSQLIMDQLARLAWNRDERIVGVGGGVVTDLAAFVSALWKRGTRLILCPTTLEAQIDAAIGGKCGVNHAAGKNLIGTFHHPQQVLVDPTCLATLSDRDYRAGLAESIKHALIADAEFFDWHLTHHADILKRQPNLLEELIVRNIKIKWTFVEPDERETAKTRMFLNFGHTLGHALETASAGTLRHGECVALGMIAAARLSERMGLLSSVAAQQIHKCITQFGLPTDLPGKTNYVTVMQTVLQDKKIREGRLTFVLLDAIGSPVLRSDVSPEQVREVLASLSH